MPPAAYLAFSSPSAPQGLYYLAGCCCEKEMLKVCFAQCLNLPLIGFGYIKAATIKIMTKTKASLKSRT